MLRTMRKGIKNAIAVVISAVLVCALVPIAYAASQASSSNAAAQPTQNYQDRKQGGFTTLDEAAASDAAEAVPNDASTYRAGEIITVLANNKPVEQELASVEESIGELSDVSESADGKLLDINVGASTTAVVELPSDVSVADALLDAANNPDVAYAQPNYIYRLLDEPDASEPAAGAPGAGEEGNGKAQPASKTATPLAKTNDPDLSIPDRQWWLEAVGAYDAWGTAQTNQAVTVAVIDTGMRLDHEDLVDNLAKDGAGKLLAWDVVLNQPLKDSIGDSDANGLSAAYYGDQSVDNGHGTHVAGIVAAQANNGKGGAGVSFNAKLLPIRVFDAAGDADTSALMAAYNYLLSLPLDYQPRVINMSLGLTYDDGKFEDELDELFRAKITEAKTGGILTVCAAGNDNSPNYTMPSDYEEVISVTNINQYKQKSSISNYNQYKDIAAPGTDIYSTTYNSQSSYGSKTGTSMASPVVAGTAALLLAKDPELTPAQVQQLLYATALDLGSPGRDDSFGYGLVQAKAALDAVSSYNRLTPLVDVPQAPQAPTNLTPVVRYQGTGSFVLDAATPAPIDGGALAYQWYRNTEPNFNYGYVKWGVKTESTLSLNSNSLTDYYYVCKVSNTKTIGGVEKKTFALTNFIKVSIVVPPKYTITYNANGGNGAQVDPSSPYSATSSVAVLGTGSIARPDYRFLYWNTDPNGYGTSYSPGSVISLTSNTTLYAIWQWQPPNTYTLTYNANTTDKNLTGTVPVDSNAYTSGNGKSLVGNTGALARPGYTFAGWASAPGSTTAISTVAFAASNITVYAIWQPQSPNTYTLTYNANTTDKNLTGTVPVDSNVYQLPNSKSLVGNTGALARPGYTFAGWAKTPGSTTAILTVIVGSSNVTVYAIWQPNNINNGGDGGNLSTYTVTLNINGGKALAAAKSKVSVAKGGAYGALSTPKRSGYTFKGWFTTAKIGGNKVSVSSPLATNADHTLYARWTANKYKVSFKVNGGRALAAAKSSKTVTFDSKFGKLPTPKKAGAKFLGWYTKAKNGSKMTANSKVKITAATKLYAHWQRR